MIEIEHSRLLHVALTKPGGLKRAAERVMDELLALEAGGHVGDAAVSADLGASTLLVELTATGVTFEDAEREADSAIRAAVHAAGGATPGWQSAATRESRSELAHA